MRQKKGSKTTTQGTAVMAPLGKTKPNWGACPGGSRWRWTKREELVHGTEDGGRDIQADSKQSLSTLILCFQLFLSLKNTDSILDSLFNLEGVSKRRTL